MHKEVNRKSDSYNSKKKKELSIIIVFLLLFLLIATIFEITILGIAFLNADTVECNLLWCTFTTERTYDNNTIIKVQNKECYLANKKINCSDFPKIAITEVDGSWNKKW